jgi:hypothetical protein
METILNDLIKKMITDRKNTMSVVSVPVIKIKDSLSNPKISIGTLPFYDWSKNQKITFVIVYGRYLDCSMLCYDSYKNDKDYFVTSDTNVAISKLTEIFNNL